MIESEFIKQTEARRETAKELARAYLEKRRGDWQEIARKVRLHQAVSLERHLINIEEVAKRAEQGDFLPAKEFFASEIEVLKKNTERYPKDDKAEEWKQLTTELEAILDALD